MRFPGGGHAAGRADPPLADLAVCSGVQPVRNPLLVGGHPVDPANDAGRRARPSSLRSRSPMVLPVRLPHRLAARTRRPSAISPASRPRSLAALRALDRPVDARRRMRRLSSAALDRPARGVRQRRRLAVARFMGRRGTRRGCCVVHRRPHSGVATRVVSKGLSARSHTRPVGEDSIAPASCRASRRRLRLRSEAWNPAPVRARGGRRRGRGECGVPTIRRRSGQAAASAGRHVRGKVHRLVRTLRKLRSRLPGATTEPRRGATRHRIAHDAAGGIQGNLLPQGMRGLHGGVSHRRARAVLERSKGSGVDRQARHQPRAMPAQRNGMPTVHRGLSL